MAHEVSTTLRAEPPTAPDGSADDAAWSEPDLPNGSVLGRYRITGLLGAGGMGAVYRAHDPKLDRVVALKVMRHVDNNPLAEARFRREAKTMAALNHPNVVPVFDVDHEGRRAFIAMEFIRGSDLKAWLADGSRALGDVLRVYSAAGRGLQAAHEAGLIHRDFKPANVLLGTDGRVMVSDFGLARVFDDADSSSEGSSDMGGRHVLADDLTEPGTAMGTLAYLSPEVLRGAPSSPLADQYAFCVALHEGVWGERPRTSIHEAPPRTPAWLYEVVVRGLDPDPDRRWPNMAGLLTALTPRRFVSRRTGVAAVVVAAAVGGLVVMPTGDAAQRECRTAAAGLASRWQEQRAALGAVAAEQASSLAREDWARVRPSLDDFARSWVAERQALCAALTGDEHDGDADFRLRCLTDQAARFESLVQTLIDGPNEATTASDALRGLGSVEACADPEALRSTFARLANPTQTKRAERLRYALAQVRSLAHTRQSSAATEHASEALTEAEALDFAPLLAEALNAHGDVDLLRGDPQAAAAAFRRAFFVADGADHPAAAFEAATKLVGIHAASLSDKSRAEDWSRHAAAILARLPGNTDAEAALLARSDATLASRFDDFERAARLLEHVIAYRERTEGPSSEALVDPLFARVGVHIDLQEIEPARRRLARIHAIVVAELGADHPMMAQWYRMTTHLAMIESDYSGAKAASTRALQIAEAAYGPEHDQLTQYLTAAADIAIVLDDHQEALALFDRAVAIESASSQGASSSLAVMLSGRADVLAELGRAEASIAGHRDALERTAYTGVSPSTAVLLHTNAALALLRNGAKQEAAQVIAKASGLAEALPNSDPLRSTVHWLQGATALADGDLATARRHLEIVNVAWLAGSTNPIQAANARLLLARALWPVAGQRARAHALAQQSLALLEPFGEFATRERAAAERWLAAHAAP